MEMTKEELACTFNEIIEKSDGVEVDFSFDDVIVNHSRMLAADHKEVLVSLMRDWLTLQSRPQTPLAIKVAEQLLLAELVPDLEQLRSDVLAGKCFYSFYRQLLDEVLVKIRGAS